MWSYANAGPANALRVEGKDPGACANRLEAEVRAPTSGEAGLVDLVVNKFSRHV